MVGYAVMWLVCQTIVLEVASRLPQPLVGYICFCTVAFPVYTICW